jgi:hypothetical protein
MIIYEIEHPTIKEDYKKQEKLNPKFSFKNTCEIYNYKHDIWEVYFPHFLNLTKKHIDDKYIATCIFYDMAGYNTMVKGLLNEESKYIYKKKYENFRLPNYDTKDFSYDDLKIIKQNTKKYYNGNYYEYDRREYIKNCIIKIRPIKNTSGYSFDYNPLIIKTNYWVVKNSYMVEEII